MKRRREDRIELALPVRVFGIDAQGKPFNLRTETVDVTRLGARIHNVTCFSAPGEVIGIQFEDKKARFRIMWIGAPGSPKEGDVGVQLLDSEKPIWDTLSVSGLSARGSLENSQASDNRFPGGRSRHFRFLPSPMRGPFVPNSPLAPSALSNPAGASVVAQSARPTRLNW